MIMPSPQKVVAVAYEGSNCRALTGKKSGVWIGGRTTFNDRTANY